MFKISFKTNTQGSNQEDRTFALARAMASADRRTRFMRCREHGRGPILTMIIDGYNITTCCEEFQQRVVQVLREEE
jgi:hypothetical protein